MFQRRGRGVLRRKNERVLHRDDEAHAMQSRLGVDEKRRGWRGSAERVGRSENSKKADKAGESKEVGITERSRKIR